MPTKVRSGKKVEVEPGKFPLEEMDIGDYFYVQQEEVHQAHRAIGYWHSNFNHKALFTCKSVENGALIVFRYR